MAKRTYRSPDASSKHSGKPVSRRNFLKMGGLTLGALGLGPLVDGLAGSVANANRIGRLNDAAPGFAPLPSSTLVTGAAADISVGWDGSTWATDANGLLHAYDPLRQSWQPFGQGIDAITAFPGSMLFRGNQVWEYLAAPAQPPQSIGTRWPQLPAAFQLGVDGALVVAGVVYLFKHGRYARADMPSQQPPRLLSQLVGWPGTWTDGLVDAMGIGGADDGKLMLIHGTQWALADLSAPDMRQHRIVAGPAPLSSVFGPRLLALLSGGVDTLYFENSPAQPGTGAVWVFQGPLQYIFSSTRAAQPVLEPVWAIVGASAAWPQHWTPQLAHAPGGRVGNLWSATKNGAVVGHSGDDWAQAPAAPGGPAVSAAVDVNGTVYAATAAALHTLANGTAWQPLAPAPGSTTLAQVSAGDDHHVWARAASGQVHRLGANNTLAPIAGLAAGHIAASFDGTLWHADGSSNAFRLLSAGGAPSEPIGVAGASNIQKVSTTGYGTSLVLSSGGAAYTYQSPYVFKTATDYDLPPGSTITQGQNSLFLNDSPDLNNSTIVALDAQSGLERWRLPLPAFKVATNPLYDAANQAVIFGDVRGYVTALAAADGRVLWTYQTPNDSPINFQPALAGSLLVFGDNTGKVYAIDTQDAMRRGAAGQPAVTLWAPYQTRHVGPVLTPVLADGQIYTLTVQLNGKSADNAVLTHLKASGTLVSAVELGKLDHYGITPVRADMVFSRGQAPEAAILINSGSLIHAYSLSEKKTLQYAVKDRTSGNQFTSNMMVYEGVVYVGDGEGYLYALDQTLKALPNTPVLINGVGNSIYTQPLVVEDAQNNVTVLVGTENSSSVWGYAVTAPAPTPVELIPTGQTWVKSLSRNATNGMIYVGGTTYGAGNIAQVFGLRLDAEISAARDFMVESQLMQDFDDPPAGQQDAVPVARYQTTLTVVDNNRAPRPFEAVKIWAEQPGTLLSVDGVQHTAGPGDTDCIVTRTDSSGKLSIISGSLAGDTNADRATDLFAVPLRVWAGFMDPFERVIVYPDREFHTRVAATTASAVAPGAGSTDPDTIDLSTATQYGEGSQKFTGDALFAGQQQTAKQIADVVQSVTGATNLKPATATRPRAVQAQQAAAPDISKYTPDGYNLPGMRYFPTNVPATRPAQALAPAGLVFQTDGQGTVVSVNTQLTAAEASAAIDALQGDDWTTLPGLGAAQVGRVGGFWGSFWKFVKSIGKAITHVVVSIGKEVYVGIRWVINGIAHFFKNPLGTLEDLVSTIGGFFAQVGKLIKNVVEALGLLLHFDRILDTKDLLRGIYDEALEVMQADIVAAQSQVDSWLTDQEAAIGPWFDKLIAQVAPSSGSGTPLSGFGGVGQTDHDAFATGAGGSAGQSRTVQCSWAADKIRHHWKQAGPSTALQESENPLLAFFEGFYRSLATDDKLRNAFNEAKKRFEAGFTFSSPEAFLSSLAADLLASGKVVCIAVVSVVKGFLDGMFSYAEAIVAELQSLGTIEIPVLSSLWRTLTGQPLTIIDLILLAVAVPVTVIYRIVEGSYPKQAAAAAIDGRLKRRVMGLGMGATYIFAGWFTAVMDALRIAEGVSFQAPIVLKIVGGLLLLGQIGDDIYQAIVREKRESIDWLVWVGKLFQVVLTVAGTRQDSESEAVALGSGLGVFLILGNAVQWFVHWDADPDSGLQPIPVTTLINNIVLQLPTVVSPFKLLPADTLLPGIVPIADLACRSGSGAVTIVQTVRNWNVAVAPAPPSQPVVRGHRYLPRIMNER